MRFKSMHLTPPAIASAALLLVCSCSEETVAPPPAPPVNWQALAAPVRADAGPEAATARERAAVDAYAQAFALPGFGQLGRQLDDDARFSFPGLEDAHGREPIVRAHEKLFGAFDQRSLTVRRVFRTKEEQTIEWTMTGLQSREWMGVAPTHRAVTARGVALIWTRDDGSITEIHLVFDVAELKAQLGQGPKGLTAGLSGASPSDAGLRTESPDDARGFESVGSPEEAAEVTVARGALDALEEKNESHYEGSFDDDAEVIGLEPPVTHGKLQARAYFRSMHKALSQLDTTVTNAWGVGSFAVLEYTIAGAQLGPIGWVPAQRDRVVLLHVVDVVEIRNGKIIRIWRYDNPAELLTSTPG
jgi:hypothetical protein